MQRKRRVWQWDPFDFPPAQIWTSLEKNFAGHAAAAVVAVAVLLVAMAVVHPLVFSR